MGGGVGRAEVGEVELDNPVSVGVIPVASPPKVGDREEVVEVVRDNSVGVGVISVASSEVGVGKLSSSVEVVGVEPPPLLLPSQSSPRSQQPLSVQVPKSGQ